MVHAPVSLQAADEMARWKEEQANAVAAKQQVDELWPKVEQRLEQAFSLCCRLAAGDDLWSCGLSDLLQVGFHHCPRDAKKSPPRTNACAMG